MPCPGGHPPESGDSNSKDQNQGQPEGASPLPGNSVTKNTSHVPHRGLQSHMTILVINFAPSLPLPHLTVTLRSEQDKMEYRSKNTAYILFPVQVSEPVSGWELWGRDEERIFKLN